MCVCMYGSMYVVCVHVCMLCVSYVYVCVCVVCVSMCPVYVCVETLVLITNCLRIPHKHTRVLARS